MKPTAPRKILISREPIAAVTGTGPFVHADANTLVTTVEYSEAGTRGYYIRVSPIKDNGDFETYLLGADRRKLLESAPRFNAKRLGEFARTIAAHPAYREARDYLIAQQGITLASPASEAA